MGYKVIVTGSGTRLAKEIARSLAEDGHEIFIHYFSARESAEALRKQIIEGGGRAFSFCSDFNSLDSYSELCRVAVRDMGSVDLLINSASAWDIGVGEGHSADTLLGATIDDWDYRMNVGARAAFFLIQEFSNYLSASENGNVINILDTSIREPYLKHACHSVSKAALLCITKIASKSLKSVRVNALELGKIIPENADLTGEIGHDSPAVRLVIDAIRFLIDDRSVDGLVLPVGCDRGSELNA